MPNRTQMLLDHRPKLLVELGSLRFQSLILFSLKRKIVMGATYDRWFHLGRSPVRRRALRMEQMSSPRSHHHHHQYQMHLLTGSVLRTWRWYTWRVYSPKSRASLPVLSMRSPGVNSNGLSRIPDLPNMMIRYGLIWLIESLGWYSLIIVSEFFHQYIATIQLSLPKEKKPLT